MIDFWVENDDDTENDHIWVTMQEPYWNLAALDLYVFFNPKDLS